jgi:synaptobrevin family protein YKT6
MKIDELYNVSEKRDDMNLKIYGFATDKVNFIITDSEYPEVVAYHLMDNLIDAGHRKQTVYDDLWIKYQDPANIDKTINIKKNIEESKVILLDTLDSLLERGEKIDDLIGKTENLERLSEGFKKKAEDQNKCCAFM